LKIENLEMVIGDWGVRVEKAPPKVAAFAGCQPATQQSAALRYERHGPNMPTSVVVKEGSRKNKSGL